MRIPSSFTDDNLYRHRGRRPNAASSSRRVMRLLVAMVLVIAVIRQAGNPRIYEVFFPEPPPEPARTSDQVFTQIDRIRLSGTSENQPSSPVAASPAGDAVAAPISHPTRREAHPAPADDPLASEALDRIVDVLPDLRKLELMEALAIRRRAAAAEPAEAEPRLTLAEGLPEQSGELPQELAELRDPHAIRQLQQVLDRWAIDRVDPAGIWKGDDMPAFYRLLEEPGLLRDDGSTATRPGVISMLQQPREYLGRRVLIPATVARVIPHQASENAFGVSEYWEVWLRPRDGSDHPLVVFTDSVEDPIAAVGPNAALKDGPPAWIDGVFLKRVAYQSAAGRQLAPAVVGLLITRFEPSPEQQTAAPDADDLTLTPAAVVGIAAAIGLLLAALIYLQSRRMAARIESLRRAGEPRRSDLAFLAGLRTEAIREGTQPSEIEQH